MSTFLALRARFAGTLQDVCGGLAIVALVAAVAMVMP